MIKRQENIVPTYLPFTNCFSTKYLGRPLLTAGDATCHKKVYQESGVDLCAQSQAELLNVGVSYADASPSYMDANLLGTGAGDFAFLQGAGLDQSLSSSLNVGDVAGANSLGNSQVPNPGDSAQQNIASTAGGHAPDQVVANANLNLVAGFDLTQYNPAPQEPNNPYVPTVNAVNFQNALSNPGNKQGGNFNFIADASNIPDQNVQDSGSTGDSAGADLASTNQSGRELVRLSCAMNYVENYSSINFDTRKLICVVDTGFSGAVTKTIFPLQCCVASFPSPPSLIKFPSGRKKDGDGRFPKQKMSPHLRLDLLKGARK